MTDVWDWAWNQTPRCTDVQRHMHHGEDTEVKSQHLSPTIPSLIGGQGYKWLVQKEDILFISWHSFIKKEKKKTGENLICFLIEFRFLAQYEWSIFFFYYVPHWRGGGHTVCDADPVCVGVNMTLSCLHDISWTGGWILTKFAWM